MRIDLGPLDRDVSRLLVNELLKKLDDVPSTLRELITGGAEGNPFYMEELVKMLVDEGAIRAGGERWSVVPERLVATHVPQTLTGVLQARLDGLDPAEKLALQQASIDRLRLLGPGARRDRCRGAGGAARSRAARAGDSASRHRRSTDCASTRSSTRSCTRSPTAPC